MDNLKLVKKINDAILESRLINPSPNAYEFVITMKDGEQMFASSIDEDNIKEVQEIIARVIFR